MTLNDGPRAHSIINLTQWTDVRPAAEEALSVHELSSMQNALSRPAKSEHEPASVCGISAQAQRRFLQLELRLALVLATFLHRELVAVNRTAYQTLFRPCGCSVSTAFCQRSPVFRFCTATRCSILHVAQLERDNSCLVTCESSFTYRTPRLSRRSPFCLASPRQSFVISVQMAGETVIVTQSFILQYTLHRVSLLSSSRQS